MSNSKKATPIYLSEESKTKLELLAESWEMSQSSVMERLLKEKRVPVRLKDVKLFDIKMFDISMIPFVGIESHYDLPESRGVYIATSKEGEVLYVGKAGGSKGLKGRWSSKRASEYKEKGAEDLLYILIPEEQSLNTVEAQLIDLLAPQMNKRDERRFNVKADLSYMDSPEWRSVMEHNPEKTA